MPTLNINNDVVLFPSANVGIKATPKAWASGYSVLNVGAAATISWTGAGANDFSLSTNAYYDATDDRWEYGGTGDGSARYSMTALSYEHRWYNAPVGTANAAISYTQAMTLTGGGNLLIGTTTDSGYKLAVNGSAGLALSSGGIVVASYDGNTGNIKPSVANGSVLISDDSGTVGRGTEFLNNGGFIASTTQSLVSSFNSSIQDTLVYTRVTATQQTTTSGTSPAAIELVGLRGDSTHGRHAWIGAEGVDSTTFRTKVLFKIRGESNSGYLWSGASEAPTILAVDGNGYVGVNNSSPINQLQIGSMGSTGYAGNHLTIGDGTSVFAVYMASNLTNLYTNKAFSFQASGSGATGNVLINTTTDAGIKLDVNGTGRFSGGLLYLGNFSGNPELILQATNNSWTKINFYDNNNTEGLYIRTDGASYGGTMTFGARWDDDEGKVFFKMFQSSAGATYDVKIGVNTGSPESMFHLDKSSSSNDISGTPSIIISNKDSTSGTFVGGGIFNNPYRDVSTSSVTAGVWFENQNSPDAGAAAKSSAVVFGANSYSANWNLPTERMRITQGGLVGVGTANPLSKFDVSLESGQALFIANEAGTISDGDLLGAVSFGSRDGSTYSSGGITNIRSYATATYNTGSVSGDMRFYVSSSLQNTTQAALFGQEAMRITAGGNVLIGTTTDAGYKLDVNGTFRSQGFLNVQGGYYENKQLYVQAGETKYLYVDIENSWGNVDVLIAGYGSAGSASCLISWIDGGHGGGTPYHRLIQLARQTQGNPVLGNVIQTGAGGAISIQNTGGVVITLQVTTRSYGSSSVAANVYLSDTAPTGNNASILNIDDINSRVGIGTTSPAQILHVSNASAVFQITDTNKTANNSLWIQALSQTAWGIGTANNASSGTKMVIMDNGNIGFGVSSSSSRLDVIGAGNTLSGTAAYQVRFLEDQTNYRGILLGYDTSGSIGIIAADTAAPASTLAFWTYSGSAWGERMRLNGSGNLLIGTTTDSGYKLDVNGVVRAQTYFVSAENVTNDGLGPYNWIYLGPGDAGATRASAVQIGDVPGAKYAIACGGYDLEFYKHVSTGSWALAYKLVASGLTDSTPDFQILYSLAVGNINPSGTTGRIDASNDIVAYSSSDRRLKENIKPIENALDKVKSLTGVEFDWKAEHKEAHGYEGHDTGVIAQEVEEVMPTAVRTNDTGYLAVRYEKLIGLLIEANKELAEQVANQQSQIDELKKLIK